jgi:molybdenum cofactor guanylyltransferase
MRGNPDPIGVVLAGGAGRRIGGSKAVVKLHGRPLISYPLEAMEGALKDVAIVAKADTELPGLPGVTVWIEPELPRHPVVGITEALGLGGGRPVLVCGADMPLLTAEAVCAIARAARSTRAPAVVASSAGSVHPLLGCYKAAAAETLLAAAGTEAPLREAVAALDPLLLEMESPDVLFNVNTPDDLLQAAAMLDRRARGVQPKVKS